MLTAEELKQLSVGIAVIDRDHSTFIEKTAGLLAECKRKTAGHHTLIEMLEFLSHYAREHFEREEQMMRACDYPGLAFHVKKHAEFREKLEELLAEQLRVDFDSFLLVQLNTFLVSWLVQHIKSEDARMSQFFLMHDLPAQNRFKEAFKAVAS